MATDRERILRAARSSVGPALAGVGAFGLGYLLAYLVKLVEVGGGALYDLPENASIGEVVGAGWVFYNAHFVGIRMDGGPFNTGTAVVNLFAEGHLTPVLFAVPPLVLLAAGLAAVRVQGPEDVRDAAVTGAATVLGYLPLAALGAFLTEVSWGYGDAHPDLVPAILLAGVAYPVLFGGIGGALAVAVGSWQSAPQPA